MHYLTVGELAKQVEVSKVAIRYYERSGLLPQAMRRASGYRQYPETVIGRIRFIKNAKSVGFTLDEIGELFALQEHKKGTSQQVKSHTLVKLKVVQEKIAALQKMADALKKLATSCDGKLPLQQCPILEALYSDQNSNSHCDKSKQKKQHHEHTK